MRTPPTVPTIEKMTLQQIEVLAGVGEMLATSVDAEDTVARLERLLVPVVADACSVYLSGPDGETGTRAGKGGEVARRWAAAGSPDSTEVHARAHVIRGATVDELPGLELRDEQIEIVRELDACSLLAVPLAARGGAFGLLVLWQARSGRRFDEAAVLVAEHVARSAALALDNARLHRQAGFERARAEEAAARAEEAARQAEWGRALLDAAFSHSPAGEAFLDRELRFERVNAACAILFGRRVEDCIGRSWDELGPDADGSVDARLRAALAGEVTVDHEFEGAGGRRILASYYPVRLEGKILGVGVVTRDITDRRRAEEERDRAHAALDAVIARAPIGIGIFDERLRFQRVNEALAQIDGLSVEEHVGRAIGDVLPEDPAAAELAQRGLEQVMREGVPLVGVECELGRDGERRQLVTTWYPISLSSGERVGVGGIVQDVTEQRQAAEEREQFQAMLVQAQKMEAIGRLAGGVAHDFNNLLTIILGYARRLTRRMDDDESVHAGIEIEQAALSGSQLIKQMLAFGRRQVLEPQQIDLNDIVLKLQSTLQSMLGGTVSLRLHLQPGHRVLVDPTQIEQVLVNLASNAVDAMPEGGELLVRTSDVELGAAASEERALRPGTHVLLQVQDTGCGMDALTVAHAFEPFFTTKEVGKGTGLGLASVYGAIEQSGGWVEVESAPGVGTTVSIYLPVVESVPVRGGSPSGAEERETILLVEDHDRLRKLAEHVLAEEGYRVLAAGAGAEALEIAAWNRGAIDLLLTDVIMPLMTGPQLAQRLRADQPLLRVVLMSGYTDDALTERVSLHSGETLLRKPFFPDELLGCVREALAKPQSSGRLRAL